MKKIVSLFIISFLVINLLSACSNSKKIESDNNTSETTKNEINEGEGKKTEPTPVPTVKPTAEPTPIDLSVIKPNEAGKIMVVMFHNFVEEFTPKPYDKGEYTTTFDAFKELLQFLYDNDYRLISMEDYLNNNIDVTAGKIPMVFTFDDGTAGQFNLVKEGEKLVANIKSAVGIMEDFYKENPDFGLEGTFYVNLGTTTFDGEGSLKDRLAYLIDKGFEIGNHTYTHIDLKTADTKEKVLKEVGGNQKLLSELIPGYIMSTFSLPLGHHPKEGLKNLVIEGEYEGVKYKNKALMEVGWDPSLSPVSKDFNPLSTHRVRASGINPVDYDLMWWIENMLRSNQYVSDGNPQTITVPEKEEANVDKGRLQEKELILY